MIPYITIEEINTICIDGVPLTWVIKDLADLIIDRVNAAIVSSEEEEGE